MSLRDAVPDSPVLLAVRAMQVSLAVMVVYALVTFELGLLVNGAIPLAVTFVPAVVKRRHGHEMNVWLVLWITTAAFLHAVGALGPYEAFGWYDQVTHTISAALVAGLGYAFVQAIDHDHEDIVIPSRLRFVFILIFVLAFGVLWEIAEFASSGAATIVGGEPVLTQYGMDDIVLDLVFDAVGGVLVALWGTGYFDGVASVLTRRIGSKSDR